MNYRRMFERNLDIVNKIFYIYNKKKTLHRCEMQDMSNKFYKQEYLNFDLIINNKSEIFNLYRKMKQSTVKWMQLTLTPFDFFSIFIESRSDFSGCSVFGGVVTSFRTFS